MKFLAFFFLLLSRIYSAGAEWTPAFDLDNASIQANMVVIGTLDQRSRLTIKEIYKKGSDWTDRTLPVSGDVVNVELDQAHLDALRAALDGEGPYEVVAFLRYPQPRPVPLLLRCSLIPTYPGLVAFDHDTVLLAPDDTTKELLVKSPDDTKASFLKTLSYTFYFAEQIAKSSRSVQKQYDAALTVAVGDFKYDLAKALLAERADVDACDEQNWHRPTLITAVEHCGRNKPIPEPAEFLGLLLSKGANPNLADKYGVTPLMMADRAGSEQAAAMLRKVGALPFDPKDPKTQAAFVRLDAELMNYVMFYRDIQETQTRALYSFDVLQKEYDDRSRMYEHQPFQWWQTYKVLDNKAVDVLGNPYVIYRNSEGHDVRINPKTVEALSSAVGPDYWEDFVPKPGEWD